MQVDCCFVILLYSLLPQSFVNELVSPHSMVILPFYKLDNQTAIVIVEKAQI